ncbi:ATP-dependent DEAD/H RNA helicase [Trypanosoma grayi]|uniref:ATP-dependent DEAD/H RNA helicase n=1 Tax=Trypanosoma grayi TaxID=71804 RepID=UPI0004F47190|nr:ATP-dependent DEAD/H RNA helicase [Trypanosoma grayi]KEG07857.1 ATP-dependent DEAD/H RNA helicase [Trypanosoma grayi]
MHRLVWRRRVSFVFSSIPRRVHLQCCRCTTSSYTDASRREPLELIDVMGSAECTSHSHVDGVKGSKEVSRVDLQQLLRDATAGERKHGVVEGDHTSSDTNNDGNTSSSGNSPYTVQISDRYGMPAELPPGAPQSFEELGALCPSDTLREQLQNLCASRRWSEMTSVQRVVIPLVLESRDVLCIAPTATGKTFCYVFPSMLSLLQTAAGRDGANPNGRSSGDDELSRSNVELLLRDKITRGEVCRYCELSVAEVRVCPMTGTPHPPIPEPTDEKPLPATRLSELASVAEPLLLILVPTSQLVVQVYQLCHNLHADFRVRYLVRASSAEEQKRHLRALEGCDVLITTPETMLPALYKRKLSLKRLRTLVLDEVDDLVSVNHFEKVKIILGALPKGHQRPQRLLFGASLPPVAYQMIKEQMLLPSHRFVLADVKTDRLGHPLLVGHTTASAGITHVVFMISQVEKMSKLAWLYSTGKLSIEQRTLIFCNSRHNVAYVCEQLQRLVPGLHVTTLTARASATAKAGTMKLFQSGASTCLVCTDILSRGIDFHNVVYVVHYDVPTDFDVWMHRSGRCGRHGMHGYCYTFFQPENVRLAKPLVAHLRQTQQLIPPKLNEYAKQSLIDTFKSSLFCHPTRPYRASDPQRQHPVLSRGTPRFPDYRQDRLNKNFRPL